MAGLARLRMKALGPGLRCEFTPPAPSFPLNRSQAQAGDMMASAPLAPLLCSGCGLRGLARLLGWAAGCGQCFL